MAETVPDFAREGAGAQPTIQTAPRRIRYTPEQVDRALAILRELLNEEEIGNSHTNSTR